MFFRVCEKDPTDFSPRRIARITHIRTQRKRKGSIFAFSPPRFREKWMRGENRKIRASPFPAGCPF